MSCNKATGLPKVEIANRESENDGSLVGDTYLYTEDGLSLILYVNEGSNLVSSLI